MMGMKAPDHPIKKRISLVLHRISMILVLKSKLGCALFKIKENLKLNNKFCSIVWKKSSVFCFGTPVGTDIGSNSIPSEYKKSNLEVSHVYVW